jgi:hypothetical protein
MQYVHLEQCTLQSAILLHEPRTLVSRHIKKWDSLISDKRNLFYCFKSLLTLANKTFWEGQTKKLGVGGNHKNLQGLHIKPLKVERSSKNLGGALAPTLQRSSASDCHLVHEKLRLRSFLLVTSLPVINSRTSLLKPWGETCFINSLASWALQIFMLQLEGGVLR